MLIFSCPVAIKEIRQSVKKIKIVAGSLIKLIMVKVKIKDAAISILHN